MAVDPGERKGFSLRRWSARKHQVARENASQPTTVAPSVPDRAADSRVDPRRAPAAAPAGSTPSVDDGAVAEVQRATPIVAGMNAQSPGLSARVLPELPPLDALTIDSDYSGFMQPGVDESLKRGALKKLFTDPRFNVMDGLDVYIDDYSKPDPIEPELVRKLVQARYIFNPPATRVNAQGFVEDVPESEQVREPAGDADGQALADNTADAATNVATIAAPDGEAIAATRVPSIGEDDETAAATNASSDAAALAGPRQS